jgi:hypothetical protein
MIKTSGAAEGQKNAPDAETLPAIDSAGPDGRSPLGVVHCFVGPEELRRLVATMAAIELVSMMMQQSAP